MLGEDDGAIRIDGIYSYSRDVSPFIQTIPTATKFSS
jgi:hypothetical protein